MSTPMNKASKVVAVIISVAVLQLYAHADLLKTVSARLSGSAAKAPQDVQGRLTTRGNNPVTVNGNSARSGETIFSGQQLQTPEGTSAAVELGPLGRLDISPGTNLTLTFDGDSVEVNVTAGCAVLTTNRGIGGTLAAPGGAGGTGPKTESTDLTRQSSVGNCDAVDGPAGAAPPGAVSGAGGSAGVTTSGGLFGLGKAGTVAFLAAAAIITTAAIVVPCRRGRNPSPGDPRGRNDECRD